MVAASYRMGLLTFPSIPTKLRLKPFDLGKMIGAFVHAEPSLPRELKRHLFTIEEKILESLAWQPGSSIYKLLELATVDPQELARRQMKGAAGGPQPGAEARQADGPTDMVMDREGELTAVADGTDAAEAVGGDGDGAAEGAGMVVEGGPTGVSADASADAPMADAKEESGGEEGSGALDNQQQPDGELKKVDSSTAPAQEQAEGAEARAMDSVEEGMPETAAAAAADRSNGPEEGQAEQQQEQQLGAQGTRRRREEDETDAAAAAAQGAGPMETDSGPREQGGANQTSAEPAAAATTMTTEAAAAAGDRGAGATTSFDAEASPSAHPSSSSGPPLGIVASAAKRHKGQNGAVSEDPQERAARLERPKMEYPLPKAVGAPPGMEGWVPPSGDPSARSVVLDYCRKVLKLAAFRLVALR
jgi:hypothetical protein